MIWIANLILLVIGVWYALKIWQALNPPPDYAGVYEAMELARAEVAADPINNDALFYEWCDGPGKDYPTHEVMMCEIEGAPVKPTQMWNDGWDKAFYAWANTRTEVTTK